VRVEVIANPEATGFNVKESLYSQIQASLINSVKQFS
jgi:hypothetical protein